MTELDVEPADHAIEVTPTDEIDAAVDPPETVDGPEYVLYGGKGGVGKTTMAAATALDSARAGRRTLVVSTDPAHSLSDSFEAEIGPRPEPVFEDLPLFAAEIDPETAMEDGWTIFGGRSGEAGGPFDGVGGQSGGGGGPFEGAGKPSGGAGGPFEGTDGPSGGTGGPFGGDDHPFGGADGADPGGPFEGGDPDGPLGGLGDLLGGESPLEGLLGGTAPGADEAAAMGVLLEYLGDERFERVVIDTAPTGHTLRLLELPELMDSMLGRFLTLRRRLEGVFGGLLGGEAEPEADLEELRERIERLRTALADPARTDFRLVVVPEEMSVIESERLREGLAEFDIPVGTVVVNRVMEPLSEITDDVETEYLGPNLDDCPFCRRRWDVQQTALARAHDLFRGVTVRRVPLFADEVRGREALAIVAACLR